MSSPDAPTPSSPSPPSPPPRGQLLRGLFPRSRPVVGMVHLLPLPGAPGWGGRLGEVVARAVTEARILSEEGMDGVMVENYGDIPFHPGAVPPETVAAMAVVVRAVLEAVEVPVGVNVLRNDAHAALAVAAATGARFIRVNVHTGAMWSDQGLIQGRAHETLRLRRTLAPEVAILADVLVKHAVPPAGVEAGEAARDQWHRGLADGLVVTGPATGTPVGGSRLEAVREAAPEAPLWIGSGVTPGTVGELLPRADGAIVGSVLHREGIAGAGIQRERVAALMEGVWRSRGDL
jgi:uncharacterized protein